MESNLEIAAQFISAIAAKDIDLALCLLCSDVEVTAPMIGTLIGSDSIRQGLQQAASYGVNWAEPTITGDSISSKASTPIGTLVMTFIFRDNKISNMDIRF